MELPTRKKALDLFFEYTKTESLRKHGLALEQVLRSYARKFGEDEELWGITGLLHDFDYERHPTATEHPMVGVSVLKEKGYPEECLEAIMGHANYTGTLRNSLLSKILFASDELTGLIFAVTYVRPSKSIHDVKVKSVTKKLKTPSFAAKVSRSDIASGIEELGVERAEHIQFVIDALKEKAGELGLAGEEN